MATRMQQRRGTAAEWTAANPILAAGEIGYAFDTGVIKIGNGVDTWSTLESAYVRRAGGDIITASASDVVPLAVRAAIGQTENLFEVLDNAGVTVAYVDPAGNWYQDGSALVTTAAQTTALTNGLAAKVDTALVDAKGDLLVGTNADTLARLVVGANGLFLKANSSAPTGLEYAAAETPAPNVQTFNVSGTWTKPAGARLISVVLIAGGGGGGSGEDTYSSGGGGGGGGVETASFWADALSNSVTVSVGAGGIGDITTSSSTDGTRGGDTTFADIFASGGESGVSSLVNGAGGAGGGQFQDSQGRTYRVNTFQGGTGSQGSSSQVATPASVTGTGGGSGGSATSGPVGAGAVSLSPLFGSGGTGGRAQDQVQATPGAVPGGGGGGGAWSSPGFIAGASGGAGRAIIITYF